MLLIKQCQQKRKNICDIKTILSMTLSVVCKFLISNVVKSQR
jgi:hypothetical protein